MEIILFNLHSNCECNTFLLNLLQTLKIHLRTSVKRSKSGKTLVVVIECVIGSFAHPKINSFRDLEHYFVNIRKPLSKDDDFNSSCMT